MSRHRLRLLNDHEAITSAVRLVEHRIMDLKALLDATLGAHVDLVSRGIRSQLKPRITAGARRVARRE